MGSHLLQFPGAINSPRIAMQLAAAFRPSSIAQFRPLWL
jgi:hypothetical protein